MSTVRNTVTISDVIFGNRFENKNGVEVQPVNINIVEKLSQFKINDDDEKEEKQIRQITINLSEFTRLLVLDDFLGLIKENDVPEDVTEPKEQLSIKYADQLRCMKGAKLTLEREEVKEVIPDETKPITDENGNPKLDENGEQMYEPVVGEDGKPVKKLVGYGDTRFIKLELSSAAAKLAEHLAYNK